jgi:UDPglucose 6-dehydrogenase
MTQKIMRRFGANLSGKTIALWGLAFKPNTDDMREAPSRVIIQELLKRGAEVVAFDPLVAKEGHEAVIHDIQDDLLLSRFSLADTAYEAANNADALLVVTEWKTFHHPDFEALKECMNTPFILDGRNLYDPQMLEELGFAYQGIGRRNRLALNLKSQLRQNKTIAALA